MWSPSTIDEIRPGATVDIHVNAKESHDFEYDLVADEIKFELISMDLQVSIKKVEVFTFYRHVNILDQHFGSHFADYNYGIGSIRLNNFIDVKSWL